MISTRRNFLRGAAGATLALPFLEGLSVARAAMTAPATRFALFYVPIGVVRRGFFPGEQDAAIPAFSSGQEEVPRDVSIPVGLHNLPPLTPTMQPLQELKDKVTLITGMDRFYKDGSDVHAQCASCFLSSATAHSVETSVYPLARTLDQLIADKIGHTTPFRSLEFSCNSHKDNKESIYFDNISWYGTEHVAPSMRDPRKAYQRMFGTSNLSNITDLVLADAKSMQKQLGQSDRVKFEEYFDGIRTIEQQIEQLEAMRGEIKKAAIAEPPETLLPRGQYIRLMGDLMVAALETGLTRVATLMIGPERWDTPFTYESLFEKPMSHHTMSHDQKKFVNQLLRVDQFHMEQYAYLVQRMQNVIEVDGSTLLDNTIFTYGSGLGDGATHQYTELPIIVAGSGGGRLKMGQHLHCSDGTPLANLWLTQANLMGAGFQRFADSTGPVNSLLR